MRKGRSAIGTINLNPGMNHAYGIQLFFKPPSHQIEIWRYKIGHPRCGLIWIDLIFLSTFLLFAHSTLPSQSKSSMKPSYIYFDLDNTLLDHTSAESKAQQATYEQYPELQKVELDIWLSKYKEVNHNLWNQYQQGLVDRHQLQFSRFNDTMLQLELSATRSTEIGNSYMQNYQNYWSWVEGVEETFSKISDRFNVGLITNGFKETQLKKYKHLSLDRYSDVMIVSEDVGKMKPHPMVFDHATEVAGVPREEILYVGDSYSSDIVGGKNAGWKTAWYTALITKNGEEDIADFEFEDFDELLTILDL